jgi:hypothetical protein
MYSEFKNIEQVLARYPLQIEREYFLPDTLVELPAGLLATLRFNLENQAETESEAFYEEAFIFPLLQWAWMRYPQLKLWSHRWLRYDDVLCGEPDYWVAARPVGVTHSLLSHPLLIVVEAKRQDFEAGWGQCLAEMLACQKLNEAEIGLTVFGMVSTGLIWEFGKLQGERFIRHPLAYGLTEPARLASNVDFVFAESAKQLV